MNCYSVVLAEEARLSKQLALTEDTIGRLPEGKLIGKQKEGRFRYYREIDGERAYLTKKDADLRDALAKKRYLQQVELDLLQEKKAVDKYLAAYKKPSRAENLLTKNPAISTLLEPMFQPRSKRMLEWAKAEYPSTAGHPEGLTHPGPEGKMYRSKAESSIAYVLYKKYLPFRYEWDRDICGITYHIDFTICHPETGQFIYWEHCGLMDRDGYAANIGTKIRDYESAGIFPERNLILTFESRQFPFETWMAEEIVDRWFGDISWE